MRCHMAQENVKKFYEQMNADEELQKKAARI